MLKYSSSKSTKIEISQSLIKLHQRNPNNNQARDFDAHELDRMDKERRR